MKDEPLSEFIVNAISFVCFILFLTAVSMALSGW